MSDLLRDCSSLAMAKIRGDLGAADAWDLVAISSRNFAGHRVDRDTADIDCHLQDIFNLDEFNGKCFPELAEAWCSRSGGKQM